MKVKIKACARCGIEIEIKHGNQKHCKSCAEEIIKESHEKSVSKRKAVNRYRIHGNTEALSRDVHESIKRGMTYGKYIAMKNDPIARRVHAILID